MIDPIGQMMGISKVILITAILVHAGSVLGAKNLPVFLGVVFSELDRTPFLYSTESDLPMKSQVGIFSEYEGYACCFKIESKANAVPQMRVYDQSEKPINVYKLGKSKSITKKILYYPIFGAAFKHGAQIQRIDQTNYLVRYEKRKAKLRICTSIESIHFYFQEEGAGEPITHLYYPLDYGVDPTCEEDIKALQQISPKP